MGLISNGTTIFDNGSMASGFGGDLNFISKATASAVASVEFTSGIDSTYEEYVFQIININPGTDDQSFRIKFSTDGGSNYNAAITSTAFYARHYENDSVASLSYLAAMDEAQGTNGQQIARSIGNGSDESFSAIVNVFNPSSTTYVKHFISRGNEYQSTNNESRDYHIAGYVNTTSAVDAIKFEITGGVFDGEIILFGVS